MKRDLDRLAQNSYDLTIIGGGIYGVCAAREAAQRGLAVCLLEKGDFGEATSANSLRIVHGGLRYLQHFDLARLRESARERVFLAGVGPHLTRNLPFVIPTHGHGLRGRLVMAVALRMYELLITDIEASSDRRMRLPGGRVVSRDECLKQIPGADPHGLTGAAIWYETHAHDSERLLLALLRDAVNAGAEIANYAEVTGLLGTRAAVTGVQVRDRCAGRGVEVRSRLVLNAAGPWANAVLARHTGGALARVAEFSKAINLVTPQLFPDRAVAIPFRSSFRDDDAVLNKGVRHFFIVPWGEYSMVGTRHLPWRGDPTEFAITEADVQQFVDEIRAAYPAAPLSREQVLSVHGGMVPDAPGRTGPEVQQLKHPEFVDHLQRDGVDGLMSVVGVKWTTARSVGEEATRRCARKLRMVLRDAAPPSRAEADELEVLAAAAIRDRPAGLPEAAARHLARSYGSEYRHVLAYVSRQPGLGEALAPGTQVLRAEITRAVGEEMAQRLSDVVLRRTRLGVARHPGEPALRACAQLMAEALGWNAQQLERELADTREDLRQRHARAETAEGGTWRHPHS